MGKRKGPGSIGDIIPTVLRKLGLDDRMDEARLVREWDGVVGGVLAGRSNPVSARDGVLLVEVRDSAWMQEFRFHQNSIIRKINERFPGLGIRTVRFRMERVEGGE